MIKKAEKYLHFREEREGRWFAVSGLSAMLLPDLSSLGDISIKTIFLVKEWKCSD